MSSTSHLYVSLAALALVALAIFPAGGCGGSSNSVVASAVTFDYVPANGPSPSVTTALGPASTASLAEVEIYVTDVLDVQGASFTLDFDPATVGFMDFDAAGSHLASDGTMIQPFAQLTQPGRITVGITRLGSSGIDFNGSRFLMKISFLRVTQNGTSALTFGNNELLDSMTPPQSIAGVQWFGGTFLVN